MLTRIAVSSLEIRAALSPGERIGSESSDLKASRLSSRSFKGSLEGGEDEDEEEEVDTRGAARLRTSLARISNASGVHAALIASAGPFRARFLKVLNKM